MKWYFKALKNYANFKGRARRKEFWMFFLFHFLIYLSLSAILIAIWLNVRIANTLYWNLRFGFGWLIQIYVLALIIPSFAVGVRRLHDTGHSGWYIFIPIYNLYLQCKEGDIGENKYGHDSKQGASSYNEALDADLAR